MSSYEKLQETLNVGWNTWNTRSVLSHVCLPYGFAIQLGVKEQRDSRYLREALIGRQNEEDEVVRPGPRSYNGTYTELTLTWRGLELRIESAVTNEGDLVLLVTPVQKQMAPAALIVECGILWNRDGYVRRNGDHIEAVFADKTIEVYTTEARIDEYHVSATVPYDALSLDDAVGISTGTARKVSEIKSIIDYRRQELVESRSSYGEMSELYVAMQTCLAWDTIYDPKLNRVITPVSRIWNDQGYKLFCWDTYFAAYMFMLDNKELAYTNAIEMTRSAVEQGFVPNFNWSGTNVSRDRSQPPVGSFVVLELYRKYKERWLLEQLFDQLYAWNRWWPDNRQIRDELLAWGSNAFTPRTGNYWEDAGVHDTFGAALESGLDNSPMYDDILFNKEKNCLELADAGLMSLYIMDCLKLAEIADILDKPVEAAALRSSAEKFGRGLQSLWDEESGIFKNLHTDRGTFSERLSPTLFYPLLTPYVTSEQTRRMIEEHLYNPEEFWGEWILPSIARNDPTYVDQDYWRGRIWAPMNFLVYLGLLKQGQKAAHQQLADKSAKLILNEWLKHGHVHENYNGSTGEGCDKANSDRYYHWGGLLAFMSMIDNGTVQDPWC